MLLLLYIIPPAILFLGLIWFLARRQHGLDRDFFSRKWNEVNGLSQSQLTWVQAVIEADKLLDEALKQAKYAGKSTAERMVNANRCFSNPDGVWTAHKLRNRVVHDTRIALHQSHVVKALDGYRQALKDLGAL